jgi:hypothetical protein
LGAELNVGDIATCVEPDINLTGGRLYRVERRWDAPGFTDVIDIRDTVTGDLWTGWGDFRFKKDEVVAPPETDMVHQPPHYARWKLQPIEFISVNELPFWLANVIKYSCRYDAKNGLEDLYKARSYLEMEIRRLEGHERWWEAPVATERKLNGTRA